MRLFGVVVLFLLSFVAFSSAGSYVDPCAACDQAMAYIGSALDNVTWTYDGSDVTYPEHLIPMCPRSYHIIYESSGFVCWNSAHLYNIPVQTDIETCLENSDVLGLNDVEWCFVPFNQALFDCYRFAKIL
mmetsp:Transcript_19761/g.27254  ORF Transcript_19761/g.27254 Transcript_19761/m.27254 type:complete len:130 (+) Transcript_19761:66-455(+)